MKLGPFLWFGGTPGNSLPTMTGIDPKTHKELFPVATHTRRNAEGEFAERKNIRVASHRRFTTLKTIDEVIEQLFGLKCPSSLPKQAIMPHARLSYPA